MKRNNSDNSGVCHSFHLLFTESNLFVLLFVVDNIFPILYSCNQGINLAAFTFYLHTAEGGNTLDFLFKYSIVFKMIKNALKSIGTPLNLTVDLQKKWSQRDA